MASEVSRSLQVYSLRVVQDGGHGACPHTGCHSDRNIHIDYVSKSETGMVLITQLSTQTRLYGATSMQAYYYFQRYGHTDRWALKALVRILSLYCVCLKLNISHRSLSSGLSSCEFRHYFRAKILLHRSLETIHLCLICATIFRWLIRDYGDRATIGRIEM